MRRFLWSIGTVFLVGVACGLPAGADDETTAQGKVNHFAPNFRVARLLTDNLAPPTEFIPLRGDAKWTSSALTDSGRALQEGGPVGKVNHFRASGFEGNPLREPAAPALAAPPSSFHGYELNKAQSLTSAVKP
jgi:hypothetical protein